MSAILIAILAVAAISVALYPLFELERRPRRAGIAIDPNLENLLSAREATYNAIKDLETDHSMGKLSDTDYATLRSKYESKALTILQQLDAVQPIMAQTSDAAARTGTPLAPPHHPTGPEWCPREGRVCASCGAPVAVDSKFCRRCGSPVVALQPV